VWQHRSPAPVAGIELAGDVLLVAADRLTAYALGTGTELWRAELRGARLGVSADGRTIVAAGEQQVSAFDRAGGTRWNVRLPDAFAQAVPDRVTVADDAVYVTFRAGPGRPGPIDVDVLAITL
jgi:outer membrane protein assembly factor BamB